MGVAAAARTGEKGGQDCLEAAELLDQATMGGPRLVTSSAKPPVRHRRPRGVRCASLPVLFILPAAVDLIFAVLFAMFLLQTRKR